MLRSSSSSLVAFTTSLYWSRLPARALGPYAHPDVMVAILRIPTQRNSADTTRLMRAPAMVSSPAAIAAVVLLAAVDFKARAEAGSRSIGGTGGAVPRSSSWVATRSRLPHGQL